MVCLGNICRSPMAEGILRQLVEETKLDVFVDSAGTANYHVGEQPDSRAIACLASRGINISHLRARQFMVEDFDEFDLIYVMDKSNYRNVLDLARTAQDSEKVKILACEFPYRMYREVPDPYYGNKKEFDEVSELLHANCKMLIDKLTRA